jgi:uncharacterized protein YkwD
MRNKQKFIIAIISLSLALSVYSQTAAASIPSLSDSEWRVVALVNNERLAKGAKPLSVAEKAQSTAETRVRELAKSFSHTRPNGTKWSTALKSSGLKYKTSGENIAGGMSTPEKAVEMLMDSSGHRANILNTAYDTIGVGHYEPSSAKWGDYWVQIFAGNAKKISSVSVASKGSAKAGKSVDDMDIILAVKYKDGTTGYAPVTSKMCSGYSASKYSAQTISISFGGAKTTLKAAAGTPSSAKAETKPAPKQNALPKEIAFPSSGGTANGGTYYSWWSYSY